MRGTREHAFLAAVLRNEFVAEILERISGSDLPGWYLSGGCVFQTVWNVEHGFEPTAGILDYDLFDLVVRPNPARTVAGEALSDAYEAKTQRWSRTWTRLTILPWSKAAGSLGGSR